MPKITNKTRIDQKRKEYAEKYNIDDLASGNDRANLELLLNLEVTIEGLTEQLQQKEDAGEIASIIKTIDTIVESKLKIEKSLGIDRVARKKESNDQSPAEYAAFLKQKAKGFLEQLIQKVYCPNCQVMVFRFAPVHDHTKFEIKCRCSQCGELIRIKREDKDIFIDLAPKDRKWREEYPVEIIQAKKEITDETIDSVEDEIIIGGE